jgi:hypothetical protein
MLRPENERSYSGELQQNLTKRVYFFSEITDEFK